jgi:hypothetical protein
MKQALKELAQSAVIAALIGFPFIWYFWSMK